MPARRRNRAESAFARRPRVRGVGKSRRRVQALPVPEQEIPQRREAEPDRRRRRRRKPPTSPAGSTRRALPCAGSAEPPRTSRESPRRSRAGGSPCRRRRRTRSRLRNLQTRLFAKTTRHRRPASRRLPARPSPRRSLRSPRAVPSEPFLFLFLFLFSRETLFERDASKTSDPRSPLRRRRRLRRGVGLRRRGGRLLRLRLPLLLRRVFQIRGGREHARLEVVVLPRAPFLRALRTLRAERGHPPPVSIRRRRRVRRRRVRRRNPRFSSFSAGADSASLSASPPRMSSGVTPAGSTPSSSNARFAAAMIARRAESSSDATAAMASAAISDFAPRSSASRAPRAATAREFAKFWDCASASSRPASLNVFRCVIAKHLPRPFPQGLGVGDDSVDDGVRL